MRPASARRLRTAGSTRRRLMKLRSSVARSIGSGSSRSVAQVRALHAHHARVVAQALDELGAPHVDGVDDPRAASEQHVGEAAGRGAGIEAGEAGRVDLEGVERCLELVARPARPLRLLEHRDRCVRRHELPGLELPTPVEFHVAGVDERLGLGARPGQAALGQELVESHSRHARMVGGAPSACGSGDEDGSHEGRDVRAGEDGRGE